MGCYWPLTDDRQGRSYLRAIFGDPCTLSETSSQTEDWRGQHLRSTIGPTTARHIILLSLSFVTIHVMIIKPGSKFSTIAREYILETSAIPNQES
ncbi:hypothetical protein Tco_0888931 [Tanacetum coccineum]